jgi:hypothetical protein
MAPTTILLKPGDDLQAAIDAAVAPAVLDLGAGRFELRRPLIQPSGIRLRGRERDVTTILTPAGAHGLLRTPRVPLAGDERPPTELDESARAWGMSFGYRLPPGRRLVGWGGGLALGALGYLKWDGWQHLDPWTLELACRFHGPRDRDTRYLLGLDAFEWDPCPWLLLTAFHVGRYLLWLRRADGRLVELTWPCGRPLEGVQRLTVQNDAGDWAAWVNDIRQPLTIGDPGLPAGTTFVENEIAEFTVGDLYRHGDDTDWTLYGLRSERVARYASTGQLTRRDGGPVDDAWRYRDDGDRGEAAHLNFLADPDYDHERWAVAKAGYVRDWLLIEDRKHQEDAWTSWQGLEGLSVHCQAGMGAALSQGGALSTLDRNVSLKGGARGVSDRATGVCYPVHFRDCDLDGAQMSFYAGQWITDLSSCNLGYGGDYYAYFRGTTGRIQSVFAAGRCPRHWFRYRNSDDCGYLVLDDLIVNDEGSGGEALVSPLLLDAPRRGAAIVTYRNSVAYCSKPDGVPFAVLTGDHPQLEGDAELPPPDCRLRLGQVSMFGFTEPADCQGNRWKVEVQC